MTHCGLMPPQLNDDATADRNHRGKRPDQTFMVTAAQHKRLSYCQRAVTGDFRKILRGNSDK